MEAHIDSGDMNDSYCLRLKLLKDEAFLVSNASSF